MLDDREGTIDIGHDHCIRWTQWSPDRELNPQYADRPDINPCGASIYHPKPDGSGDCAGHVTFDFPGCEHLADDAHRWTVVSLEPLTITPSVLCRTCGDHGFITDGRWIPA
jgi:hypothetical protein